LALAQNKPSKCANLGAQDLTRESDFGARFVCWWIGFLFAGSCVCRLFCKSSWAFLLLPFVFLPWHLAAFCVVNVATTWGFESYALGAFQPGFLGDLSVSDRCGNSVNCGRCSKTDASAALERLSEVFQNNKTLRVSGRESIFSS